MHVPPSTTSCGDTTLAIVALHSRPVPPPPWPTRNIPLPASVYRPLPPWPPATSWPVHAPGSGPHRSPPTSFCGRETIVPGSSPANRAGLAPSHTADFPWLPPPPTAV